MLYLKYFLNKDELSFKLEDRCKPSQEMFDFCVWKKQPDKIYIDYPQNVKSEIYIPTNFSTLPKSDYFYNQVDIELVVKLVKKTIKECPQCILDLKAIINDTTIHSNEDLRWAVINFNVYMEQKLKSYR